MKASEHDEAVAAWLGDAPGVRTEELPAPLQSRWVDAAVLPAGRLGEADVKLAVQEEVAAFEAIFGRSPSVVVPPTFIWNDAVEKAWAAAGVGIVVTPGSRYTTRDESGAPAGKDLTVHNGQVSASGLVYVVRDVYFEPLLGHTPRQALDALVSKATMGRPALIETHRFNFVTDEEQKQQSLERLKQMLQGALATHPALAFMSTAELAGILRSRDTRWIESRYQQL